MEPRQGGNAASTVSHSRHLPSDALRGRQPDAQATSKQAHADGRDPEGPGSTALSDSPAPPGSARGGSSSDGIDLQQAELPTWQVEPEADALANADADGSNDAEAEVASQQQSSYEELVGGAGAGDPSLGADQLEPRRGAPALSPAQRR